MIEKEGLIKFIDSKKQMGFITPDDGESGELKDVFFRFKAYKGESSTLKAGQRIKYILKDGEADEVTPQ